MLEKLLSFLDSPSIVNLAQAHTLALQTLQRPIVWKAVTGKIVDISQDGWKREQQEDGGWKWKTEDGRDERAFFDFHQDKMEVLVSIVDLVNSDEIKIYLVDLICDRFGPSIEDYDNGEPIVRMSFSSLLPHQHRNVSDLGFFLLEKLKLGEVEEVCTHGEEELLLALHRRVSSQQGMFDLLAINSVRVGTAEGAEAFAALAKRCKTVEVGLLKVVGDIGSQGWSALRETMENWGGDMCTLKIRLGEGEAKKESWEALMETAHVWGRSGCSMKLDPTAPAEWEEL